MYPLSNGVWCQVVVGRRAKDGSLSLDLRKHMVSKQKLIPNRQEGVTIPQSVWGGIVDLFDPIEKALEQKELFRKEFCLSERNYIVIEVTVFKQKAYFDIRDYFIPEGEEELRPTKRGCKISREGFTKLRERSEDIISDFKVLKEFA